MTMFESGPYKGILTINLKTDSNNIGLGYAGWKKKKEMQ